MWKSAAMEESKGKLIEDFRAVMMDAEELLKATASQTGDRVSAARAKATESLEAAKGRLADIQGVAMEQARVAAQSTDIYAHKNPWTVVGIAAVVGIVVGAMINTRR